MKFFVVLISAAFILNCMSGDNFNSKKRNDIKTEIRKRSINIVMTSAQKDFMLNFPISTAQRNFTGFLQVT